MPGRFLAAAEAAADAAGAAIRPWFRRPIAADLKADQSPVTQADRAAELAMRAVLARHWPAHAILGEEFGQDPHFGHAPGDYEWVLDPIDGTRAFLTGRPMFGTLVGLLHEGRPVLGIIDQPITGERWIGLAGEPARFRGPLGGQAGTRRLATLAEAELSCTSPEMLGDAAPRWGRLAAAVRRVTWGGDCYAYGLLALGQIDIVAERDLKIWDWAALVPIVEGAGGRMTDWAGRPLDRQSAGDALAVGDPRMLKEVVEELRPGGQRPPGPLLS